MIAAIQYYKAINRAIPFPNKLAIYFTLTRFN